MKFDWLSDIFLGCGHGNLSRVFTVKGTKRSYVVCLTCGTEYDYDWATMRVGKEITVAPDPSAHFTVRP